MSGQNMRLIASGIGCGVVLVLFAVAVTASTFGRFDGYAATSFFEGFRDGMAICGFAVVLLGLWCWVTEPDHSPDERG